MTLNHIQNTINIVAEIDYIAAAYLRLFNQHNNAYHDREDGRIAYPSTVLISAFSWRDSPQEYEYWNDLYAKLNAIEDSPITLEEKKE